MAAAPYVRMAPPSKSYKFIAGSWCVQHNSKDGLSFYRTVYLQIYPVLYGDGSTVIDVHEQPILSRVKEQLVV